MEPQVGNSYGNIPDLAIDNDVSLPIPLTKHVFNKLPVL
jgi:hypothetical protein